MIRYAAYTENRDGVDSEEGRILVDNHIMSGGSRFGEAENELLALVCAGKGSSRQGYSSACMVTDVFYNAPISGISAASISGCLHRASRRMSTVQEKGPEGTDMISTAAGIAFYRDRYIMFRLGDVYIYTCNDRELSLWIKGGPARAGIRDWNQGYLGGDGFSCIPVFKKGIIQDESSHFLVCSRHVFESVEEDILNKVLVSSMTTKDKAGAILECLHQNGSVNPISFVLLDYTSSTSSPKE